MARIKKTRRNLPSLSRKPPNKPPAPSSSEDDIVSGTVTPVTTPEDSDASSVQHSESSRAEHSPYFESLIDSSSSHNSIAPEGSRKSTPEASSEGGGDSTPPAGTFGGRSCSLDAMSLHQVFQTVLYRQDRVTKEERKEKSLNPKTPGGNTIDLEEKKETKSGSTNPHGICSFRNSRSNAW
ncbi:unnamed protein product [Allacma fusca]|uniref:Uncharacterized protein n=1 Tax=Allacma fusca TaxID=39272 RepID=A0A8J2KE84_9HEXA|nr:unnamed protein product [Allacma fusca]